MSWSVLTVIKLTPVTYFPPLSKHCPQCFKTNTYQENENIKITTTQMYTHFTQLYIAGNFPYLTDVFRISGGEWRPTRPSHHLNLFSLNRLYTKLAKYQTVRIHLSNLTCSFCFPWKSLHICYAIVVRVNNPWPNAMFFFQFPNVLHYHVLPWKSIQSSAIDYFKSHLLAQHSMNEGESATNLRVTFNLKHYNIQMTHTKTCPACPSLWNLKWSKLKMARIHKFCTEFV